MLKNLRKEYYKKRKSGKIIIVVLIFLLGFSSGFLGGVSALSVKGEGAQKDSAGQIIAADEENATINAVKKNIPATVNIVITKDIGQLYNQALPQSTDSQNSEKVDIGGGSGFIVKSDGLIVTNKHVVADTASEYSVILSDNRRFDAKIIAKDPLMDLAFLKIDAKDLPVVTLGDSDKLSTGQTVIAIGYTLSEYQNSVTKGIISGIKRQISAQGETIDQAIQTDAAINPGNSGGPLLNLQGEVIGINTAINEQGQLIGFSLPINSAKKAISSVESTGKVVRPWLGVRYLLLNPAVSSANKLSVTAGAYIIKGATAADYAVVPGSPADKAGLKEGDIILSVNGIKIDDNNSLASLLGRYDVSDTINLKVLRANKEMDIKVTLEAYK